MQSLSGFWDMVHQFVSNNGFYVLAGAGCVMYLSTLKKKGQSILVISAVILLAVFFNPFSFNILIKMTDEVKTYYRLFWIFPVIPMTAYFFYQAVSCIKRKYMQLLIVIVICTGILVINISKEDLRWPENIWQIPGTTVEVADNLAVLMEAQGEAEVMVLADMEVLSTIRQYNAHIKIPKIPYVLEENRDDESVLGLMSMLMYNRDDISAEAVKDIINENKIDYIVISINNNLSLSYMHRLHWQIVATTSAYHILQYQEPVFSTAPLSAAGLETEKVEVVIPVY